VTLAGIKTGDLIEADVRGDRFYAEVTGRIPERRWLEVHPIGNGRGPIRYVNARQVLAHWRRAGRSRRAADQGDPS
jgi:hypothetical protein